MKTMNSLHASGCPDTEALAEFAANPAPDLFPEMAEHVRKCARCRAAARQYRMITRVLETACEPPENLSARIRAAVCKDAQMRSRRFRGLWIGAAAAAVFVLSLHTVFANWNTGKITTAPEASLAMAKTPAQQESAVCKEEAVTTCNDAINGALCDEAPAAPLPQIKTKQANTAQAPVPNNLKFARPVATQLTPEFGFVDDTSILNVRHNVPANVTHIWKASSPFSLQAAAARHQCAILSIDDSHTGYDTYTLQGNDSAVQALVDDLYDRNWVLYSADYPQPGQRPATLFADTAVRYEMKVIR